MPVKRLPVRPLSPVKPFSNTRGKSASETPQPLSATESSTASVASPSSTSRPVKLMVGRSACAYLTLF